jgi:Kef-type K+ transport system membrane component KefB
MSEFVFLPNWSQPLNGVALFGALLLAGLFGGVLFGRLRLPVITGYVVVGILLGKSGLSLLTPDMLLNARVFVDISLGLVLFDLGRRLDLGWLRKDRFLFAASLSESLLSAVFIYVTLYYFDIPPLFAAAAAAIGISSSPAIVMLVAQEQRAEGQVTERALNLVAINSVFAFIAVTMLLTGLHYEYDANLVTMVAHPLYLVAGSSVLGLAAAIGAIQLGRLLGPRNDRQFVMLVAIIVLTVGVAGFLKLSVLLALLVAGVYVKNFDKQRSLIPVEIAAPSQLFYVVLFVVTGTLLDVKYLLTGGLIALLCVAARIAGKVLGVMPWAMMSGLGMQRSALLGLTLTPMAGFAIVLVQDVWLFYPEFNPRVLAIMMSTVLILDLLGPVMVQYALRRSGEADQTPR